MKILIVLIHINTKENNNIKKRGLPEILETLFFYLPVTTAPFS
jgi:hypothetical protein